MPAAPPAKLPTTQIRPVGAGALLIDLAWDATPADVETWRVELRRRRESGDLCAIEPGGDQDFMEQAPFLGETLRLATMVNSSGRKVGFVE